MTKKRSSWRAKFIRQRIKQWGVLHRRIYFAELRNEDELELIVQDKIYIDESESLKIYGVLNKGDVVYFYADYIDGNLSNIEFYGLHAKNYGGENE